MNMLLTKNRNRFSGYFWWRRRLISSDCNVRILFVIDFGRERHWGCRRRLFTLCILCHSEIITFLQMGSKLQFFLNYSFSRTNSNGTYKEEK